MRLTSGRFFGLLLSNVACLLIEGSSGLVQLRLVIALEASQLTAIAANPGCPWIGYSGEQAEEGLERNPEI